MWPCSSWGGAIQRRRRHCPRTRVRWRGPSGPLAPLALRSDVRVERHRFAPELSAEFGHGCVTVDHRSLGLVSSRGCAHRCIGAASLISINPVLEPITIENLGKEQGWCKTQQGPDDEEFSGPSRHEAIHLCLDLVAEEDLLTPACRNASDAEVRPLQLTAPGDRHVGVVSEVPCSQDSVFNGGGPQKVADGSPDDLIEKSMSAAGFAYLRSLRIGLPGQCSIRTCRTSRQPCSRVVRSIPPKAYWPSGRSPVLNLCCLGRSQHPPVRETQHGIRRSSLHRPISLTDAHVPLL